MNYEARLGPWQAGDYVTLCVHSALALSGTTALPGWQLMHRAGLGLFYTRVWQAGDILPALPVGVLIAATAMYPKRVATLGASDSAGDSSSTTSESPGPLGLHDDGCLLRH